MRVEIKLYFDDGTLISHDAIYDMLSSYKTVHPIGGYVLEGGFYRILGWNWEPQITSIEKVEEFNAISK